MKIIKEESRAKYYNQYLTRRMFVCLMLIIIILLLIIDCYGWPPWWAAIDGTILYGLLFIAACRFVEAQGSKPKKVVPEWVPSWVSPSCVRSFCPARFCCCTVFFSFFLLLLVWLFALAPTTNRSSVVVDLYYFIGRYCNILESNRKHYYL